MPKPERTERSRALIGALIIAVLVGVIFVIISLDDLTARGESRVQLVAALKDASGIAPGTVVWLEGHPIGEVESIQLGGPASVEQHRVHATVSIPESYLPLIRANGRARLRSANIMGEQVVELLGGTEAAPPVQPGDTLYAEASPLAGIDVARLEEVIASGRNVAASVARIDSIWRLRAPAVQEVRTRMGVVAAELERLSAQIESGPLGQAMEDDEIGARIEAIRSDVALARRGLSRYGEGELQDRLATLDQRLAAVSARVDTLRTLTEEPHGFIGRMATDSALVKAIGRARAQADSLIQESMADPFRYFF